MIEKVNLEFRGQYLSEIWDSLPPGIIVKNAPGIGATHLELFVAKRHSILVSPLVSIIKSKESKGEIPEILSFYGDLQDKENAVDKYLKARDGNGYFKIHVTAESLPTLFRYLEDNRINPFEYFHFVLDEHDLMQLQSEFREFLPIAFDYYKLFPENKRTCLSATHYLFSDPEFSNEPELHFIITGRKPREIELIKTNNSIETVLQLLSQKLEGQIFIFVDSIEWINTLLNFIDLKDFAVYCSNASSEKVKNYRSYESIPKARLCFFTSAYFVGCDLLSEPPNLITVTDPLIQRGLTKAQIIQIHGRARKGVKRDIIVSTCSSSLEPPKQERSELIQSAGLQLDYYKNWLADPHSRRNGLKILTSMQGNLNIRLNYKNDPTVNYSWIDSKIIRDNDTYLLYNNPDAIEKFLQEELKSTLNIEILNFKNQTKLMRQGNSLKREAFLKAADLIKQNLITSLNDPGQFYENEKASLANLVRVTAGKVNQYLNLYSKIMDYEVFMKSNGDVSKLENNIHRNVIQNRMKQQDILLSSYFLVGERYTVVEVHSILKKLFEDIHLPQNQLGIRRAKKYLDIFCSFNDTLFQVEYKRIKGVIITDYLI
jgi:uncharacterized phage-like protein YoqJ